MKSDSLHSCCTGLGNILKFPRGIHIYGRNIDIHNIIENMYNDIAVFCFGAIPTTLYIIYPHDIKHHGQLCKPVDLRPFPVFSKFCLEGFGVIFGAQHPSVDLNTLARVSTLHVCFVCITFQTRSPHGLPFSRFYYTLYLSNPRHRFKGHNSTGCISRFHRLIINGFSFH